MEIGKEVNGRAVLAVWLQNDWRSPRARQEIEFRLSIWNVGLDLIEHPRLDRAWDHWVRVKILEGFREPVWERLPEDIRWVEASAAPGDIPGWYARPGDPVWEILSGGSGRISDVAACARAGELPRGCPVREASRCQESLDMIKRMARGIDRRPISDLLLLLAPSESGPATILDGHKRAAAVHWLANIDSRADAVPSLPAYLGLSPTPSPFRRG